MKSTVLAIVGCAALFAQSARVTRCQSGPSGIVVDANVFKIETPRARFVFPGDKSLVIHCEFEGQPGRTTLTGIWKDPTGRNAFVSSDIQMQVPGRTFSAYWTYYLNADMPAGPWTLEIRVNGQPAGSHVFEVVTPAPATIQQTTPLVEQKKFPTLDELFARKDSLVWIRKRDKNGRVIDTATGFVIGQGQIATAFEAIDAAASIEIETASGQKRPLEALFAWNRMQNWAILSFPTGSMKPFEKATEVPKLGFGLTAFSSESEGVRTIGGIDFTGRNATSTQWALQPKLPMAAVGGPLLDSTGVLVGILATNNIPGFRVGTNEAISIPRLRLQTEWTTVGLPIALLGGATISSPVLMADIDSKGNLTPPLNTAPDEYQYAAIARDLPKQLQNGLGMTGRETLDIPKSSEGAVYSLWRKPKSKVGAGFVSMTLSSPDNSVALKTDSVKVKLPAEGSVTQQIFRFSAARLPAGVYRVDLLWNGAVIWRSGLRILD